MFISKLLMEWLPNGHLIGVLTITYTLVYRKKALVPIYVFVFLTGLYYGFALWWVPYLYLWTLLWAGAMLIPKKLSPTAAVPVYMTLCALHGLLFGTLYAPFQALAYHLDFEGMLAWIAVGIQWDIRHAIYNFMFGTLIFPLAELLKKLEKNSSLGKVK